jgi:hypothetical protein
MAERNDPQQPEQITDRVVGAIHDYGELIDIMRVRAQERRIAITSPRVAKMAGLPDYYIAKLLSVHPVRRVGMISLGPLLSVLGVRLLMVEDEEAMQKYSGKLDQRVEHAVHDGAAIRFSFSRRFMRKIGLKGAEVRWSRVRQRSAAASRAAKARWAKAAANG